MSEYLKFEEGISPSGKTKVVYVISERTDKILGWVKWYGQWRQYAFFPADLTIWNRDCLTEIQNKIENLMKDRAREVKGE